MPDDAGRWSKSRLLRIWGLSVGLLMAVGALSCGSGSASASLFDGRAWEMVSQTDKNGGDILSSDDGGGVVQASAGGERVTYVSLASFADPQGASLGSQYVSTRNANVGWMTQNISTPTTAQVYNIGGLGTPFRAFSSDLSHGLIWGGTRGGGATRPVEGPSLAGAPPGYENFYLDSIPSGALQPLLTEAPAVSADAFELKVLGTTADLTHVLVRSRAALGGGAVEENGAFNLYGWDAATGHFLPVNVLPDGTPDPGAEMLLGGSGGATERAISEDGSRVIWTTRTGLYVREGLGTGHQAITIQADAPAGGGRFLTASSDGAKVFFADNERLTVDSTSSGGGFGDLYRFEPEGRRLKDLTVDTEDPGGAEVQGVLGASKDGSYVYFVADGVLASGASRGDCSTGTSPLGATCNLYLWHEGEGTKFIAALAGNDKSSTLFNALGVAFDWDSEIGQADSEGVE